MIEILPNLAAILTLSLGMAGLAFPVFVAEQLGIEPKGSLVRSELRATYCGLFIGLGLICLWLQSPDAFLVAGFAWMSAACGRVLSIMIEREVLSKNIVGILVEGLIGGLFLASVL